MSSIRKVLPPQAIGIIGAGQLGKMLAQEAKQMGYKVIVLDPKPNAPAGQISDEQIVAEFSDFSAIERLAMKTQVLTYEFEHIDADVLEQIESIGYKVYPSSQTLKKIQNKLLQKEMLLEAGIPTAAFEKVTSVQQLKSFYREHGHRMVIKACKGGYDGKGNWFVHTEDEIEPLYNQIGHLPLYVEAYFPYAKEVSVIYARSESQVKVFPIAENTHDTGILMTSLVPARIENHLADKAVKVAFDVAQTIADYGVFCIEMFVGEQGEVLVNEIAPRPHNTGHYTIEACNVSQYGQLLRVMTGMPLSDVKLLSPCVMHNVLGTSGVSGTYLVEGIEEALKQDDCYLHLYGKPDTQPRKKMGHITVLAETGEKALTISQAVASSIKFVSVEGGF